MEYYEGLRGEKVLSDECYRLKQLLIEAREEVGLLWCRLDESEPKETKMSSDSKIPEIDTFSTDFQVHVKLPTGQSITYVGGGAIGFDKSMGIGMLIAAALAQIASATRTLEAENRRSDKLSKEEPL